MGNSRITSFSFDSQFDVATRLNGSSKPLAVSCAGTEEAGHGGNLPAWGRAAEIPG